MGKLIGFLVSAVLSAIGILIVATVSGATWVFKAVPAAYRGVRDYRANKRRKEERAAVHRVERKKRELEEAVRHASTFTTAPAAAGVIAGTTTAVPSAGMATDLATPRAAGSYGFIKERPDGQYLVRPDGSERKL